MRVCVCMCDKIYNLNSTTMHKFVLHIHHQDLRVRVRHELLILMNEEE